MSDTDTNPTNVNEEKSEEHCDERKCETSCETKRGRVKWFDPRRGWGFITSTSDTDKDYYVHHTGISTKTDVFKTLLSEEYVEFRIRLDDEGLECACEVQGIDGGPLRCESERRTKRRDRSRSPKRDRGRRDRSRSPRRDRERRDRRSRSPRRERSRRESGSRSEGGRRDRSRSPRRKEAQEE